MIAFAVPVIHHHVRLVPIERGEFLPPFGSTKPEVGMSNDVRGLIDELRAESATLRLQSEKLTLQLAAVSNREHDEYKTLRTSLEDLRQELADRSTPLFRKSLDDSLNFYIESPAPREPLFSSPSGDHPSPGFADSSFGPPPIDAQQSLNVAARPKDLLNSQSNYESMTKRGRLHFFASRNTWTDTLASPSMRTQVFR